VIEPVPVPPSSESSGNTISADDGALLRGTCMQRPCCGRFPHILRQELENGKSRWRLQSGEVFRVPHEQMVLCADLSDAVVNHFVLPLPFQPESLNTIGVDISDKAKLIRTMYLENKPAQVSAFSTVSTSPNDFASPRRRLRIAIYAGSSYPAMVCDTI
jgi:hypothetical protein